MDSSFVLKNLSANQNRGEFLSSEQQWKMAVSSEGSLAYSSDSFSNTSLIKFRVTRSKGRIIPVEKSKLIFASKDFVGRLASLRSTADFHTPNSSLIHQ